MKYLLTVFIVFTWNQSILAVELAKNSERTDPQKFNGPKKSDFSEEVILNGVAHEFDSEDDVTSRRELAEIVSDALTIKGDQKYFVRFSGQSCVKFSVTSSPEDLEVVMMMTSSSFLAYQSNLFLGAYSYVLGSRCLQTNSCSKTVDGLARSESYYLLLKNDYDGVLGGDDAQVRVSISTCSSTSPSDWPSYSSPATCTSAMVSLVLVMMTAIYMI